jgi:hypothetical protein
MDSDRSHFSCRTTEEAAISLPDHPQQGGEGVLTFGSLTDQLGLFLKGIVLLWTIAMVVAVLQLLWNGEAYALPFAIVAGSSLIPMTIWKNNAKGGIPFLVFFVIQQGLIYLLPLYISNITLLQYSPEVVMTSALGIALFLVSLSLGWRLGSQQAKPYPSSLNISGDDRENAHQLAMRIGMALLFFSLIAESIPFFIYLGTLLPIISAGSGAAATLGAMLGGYAIGVSGQNKPSFWVILSLLFFIAIHDILLSAASSFVVAAIIGLALGSKKIPWKILIIVFSLLTFLSAGKVLMRERYWTKESNSTGVPLSGLPAFYNEWFQASLVALQGKTDQATQTAIQMKESNSQSFAERINNFQNMAFVVRALATQHLSPLYGATYTLIPPLFVPRILWPSKPRAHAGQDLLNIHFERQREVDVELTFIAWGLLPEAVGNFGIWGGAIFLGIVIGYLLGYLESWSLLKEFFSVEGLILMGFWLKLMVSYEFVSSVFITSTFQMLIVIALGGGMLRTIFGSR